MAKKITQVKVKLGKRSYKIFLGYDIWPACVAKLDFSAEKDVFLISDAIAYSLHGAKLAKALSAHGCRVVTALISPGEGSKTWQEAGSLLERMLVENFSRKTHVLALGGGVVGDLAGFVAAVYRRGVPLIQVPTTLLAQVDSSVGGKVAVNHPLGKNMLGTFYQPQAVWADLGALGTLPQEEWRAGLAEVLKYAVILDREFFLYLENHAEAILKGDHAIIQQIIKRCCELKAGVVAQDEGDQGVRNILNFGHTIGHALESATSFRVYRHGEAVAIGMLGAMEIAFRLGMTDRTTVERVERLLQSWLLPTRFPRTLLEMVEKNIRHDKKAVGNTVTFILSPALGQTAMRNDVPPEIIRQALESITE